MTSQEPHQISSSQQASQPQPQGVSGLPGDAAASMPAGQPADDSVPAISSMQVPDDASDADLIEKEWVVKAKDIVQHTQDNPYEQQKALSKFKADYMKKRYNKDIKTESA